MSATNNGIRRSCLTSRLSLWAVGRSFLTPLRKWRQFFCEAELYKTVSSSRPDGRHRVCAETYHEKCQADGDDLLDSLFQRAQPYWGWTCDQTSLAHGLMRNWMPDIPSCPWGDISDLSQLARPHAWGPSQAETAAFQSLCLLLIIRLPPEHFGPGEVLSGIMTLKGNSSQPTLAMSDLGVSKVAVSSPSKEPSLLGGYSVIIIWTYDEYLSADTSLSLFALVNWTGLDMHLLGGLGQVREEPPWIFQVLNPSVGLAALD